MTDIIVGHPFNVSKTQREHGLSSIKRLYLAFLVHTQHHSFIRGIEVKPHNISHFLNKERIGRELKVALPMRLKAKSPPDPMHSCTRQFSILGCCPDGPMCSILRFSLNGLANQHGNFFIRNRSWPAWTQFVMQARQSLLKIALTPMADALMAKTDSVGNRIIRNTVCIEQYNGRSSANP